MRWHVEVTSLGNAEKDSLYVDAESWQKALQSARTHRGEDGSMAGFSIELLTDGCRAVDGAARVTYLVQPAAESAARTPFIMPSSAPPRPATHSTAPRSSPSAPPPALVLGALTPPMPIVMVGPAPSAPPQPIRAELSSMVPSQVIFKREQDATESLPLTYREYVYAVPPGSSEAAAATLIQRQLDLVRSSLERMPPGKLVNLAVFDSTFQGRPPVPPLATLAWKDWRGAPVVSFPRRGTPFAGSSPPPAASQAPPPPPPPTAPLPVFPPETAVYVAPSQAPVPDGATLQIAPHPAPLVMPPAAQAAAPLPGMVASAPPAAVVEQQQQPPALVANPAGPWRQRPATVPGAAPGPAPARASGEDLIGYFFESMHEVHFARDAVEGGLFCLDLALDKLPSLAGLVELYDINRREFLVTSTRGEIASSLLLCRYPEADPLLSLAMRRRRAVVIADATDSEAATMERYVVLGGARSLIVAPVMLAGRFLGAIELVNPLDGHPFTESDGNAITYMAEQFAEFVAKSGVVTDPERIATAAAALERSQ